MSRKERTFPGMKAKKFEDKQEQKRVNFAESQVDPIRKLVGGKVKKAK